MAGLDVGQRQVGIGAAGKVRPVAAQFLPLICQRFCPVGHDPEGGGRADIIGQALGLDGDERLGDPSKARCQQHAGNQYLQFDFHGDLQSKGLMMKVMVNERGRSGLG